MSAAYLVIYEGVPEHRDEFFTYYRIHHVPLVWRFPGIRGVEMHVGGAESEVFLVTRLLFDSLGDLNRAITSPEREAARRDMANFPPFEGRVLRAVTEIDEVPPR